MKVSTVMLQQAVRFVKPSTEKLARLRQLQADVFRETYNPDAIRTGAKFLRKNLKGQHVANYYGPVDFPTVSSLNKLWKNDHYQHIDENEEYRMEYVEDKRRRGKGAPKKIREKPDASGKKKKKK